MVFSRTSVKLPEGTQMQRNDPNSVWTPTPQGPRSTLLKSAPKTWSPIINPKKQWPRKFGRSSNKLWMYLGLIWISRTHHDSHHIFTQVHTKKEYWFTMENNDHYLATNAPESPNKHWMNPNMQDHLSSGITRHVKKSPTAAEITKTLWSCLSCDWETLTPWLPI